MLAGPIIVGQYKPSVYTHLRNLLFHSRSPFRSCLVSYSYSYSYSTPTPLHILLLHSTLSTATYRKLIQGRSAG